MARDVTETRRGIPRALIRPAIGLAAVVLCAVVLASRVRAVANEPRMALGPRVVQFMNNRMLALRIDAYARRYGRPAYAFDSVLAHLDSAEARLVSDLRTDLWGDQVVYGWSWCGYTVSSGAGLWQMPWFKEELDSARSRGRSRLPFEVSEEYSWPRGVGRTYDCGGGP